VETPALVQEQGSVVLSSAEGLLALRLRERLAPLRLGEGDLAAVVVPEDDAAGLEDVHGGAASLHPAERHTLRIPRLPTAILVLLRHREAFLSRRLTRDNKAEPLRSAVGSMDDGYIVVNR
jgi:hypothetical protein